MIFSKNISSNQIVSLYMHRHFMKIINISIVVLGYHNIFSITYGLDYHFYYQVARVFLQILQQVKLGNKA